MADEMRLPEELAAFEALLAARALPTSRLDRDQVMYRAGWGACEAQFYPPPSKGWEQPSTVAGGDRAQGGRVHEVIRGGISDRRHTFAWSCASAALAASLAIAMTLGWVRVEQSEVADAERAGGETPRLAADGVAATVPVGEERHHNAATPSLLHNLDRYIDGDARGGRPALAGPWLAMQRLDLRQVDSRNDHVANDVEATPATPKTIRNLQHELLPNAVAPTRFVWPWERTTSGDSI